MGEDKPENDQSVITQLQNQYIYRYNHYKYLYKYVYLTAKYIWYA